MRAVRILVRAGVALAALVAIAAAAVAWLLGTTAGTAWLLERALARAAPYVTVDGGVSGTLLDTVVLRDVGLTLPGHEIATPRVSVSLDPGALLGGTLRVRELDIAAAEYGQLPVDTGAAAPGGGGGLDLPVDVVVERVAIAGVEVRLGETVHRVGPSEAAVTLRGRRLAVERLSTSAAGFDVAGRLSAVLTEPLSLDAALGWSGSYAGHELAGSLEASGTPAEIEVRHELTAPFPAVTGGTVEAGDELAFELDTEWTDAALEAFGPVQSSSGRLKVAGTVERFDFTGNGRVLLESPDGALREAEVELSGAREGDTVRVAPVSLRAALGRVEATGSLDLAALTFTLDVVAEQLDPSSELPDWPADLDARGRLSGRLEPDVEVSLEGLRLDGELRGRPLTASGALGYSTPGGLDVRDLTVRSGASRATLDGSVGERVDAHVDASIEDLARWWPGLEGALQADVALAGSIGQPRLSGRVAATGLAYDDTAAEIVSFEGEVGTALDAPVAAVVEARGVSRGTLAIDSIRTDLEGEARDHRIALEVAAPQWSASGRAAGGIDGRRWQGVVSALDIVQDALGAWRLSERVELALGPGAWRVGSACLRQAAASLCGSLTLTGSAEDALRLSASSFDLRTLEPFMPPDIDVQGVYELDAAITNLSGSPSGSITVDGAPTTVGVALSETQSAETVIDSVTVDVELSDWAMRVDAGLTGRQTGRATLELDVDDIRAESSPVAGRISMGWQDLAPLSLLTPDVGRVGGRVGVELLLGGTLEEPTLEGSAELIDGSLFVPAWGAEFDAIEARATSRDGRTLDVSASARGGEGTLTLEGTTRLDPGAGWPTRAVLRGERVLVARLPEAEVLVSPDLDVAAAGSGVDVTGTVHVPSARIEIEQLPQQAVTPSADAVVHRAADTSRPEPRPLDVTADMTLTLGDDVSYEGAGLAADLAGELRLRYRSGQPEDATGTLNIDGTYTAYGQTLELERGRLVFTGPLDNPALDVRAVRRIEETTVGVQLSGSLKVPQTSIFSMPAMSEADALSYLLFGRPLEDARAQADSAALEGAALSMGLRQALPVVERIGETLGLDELTVGSTEVGTSALMAGKQLSPKLYMRYSYGLFNRIGGLLLRFKINERLSLETRSGDRESMDLLYTVEKE